MYSNRKLNLYFFGEVGEYDSLNPAYVCKKDYAKEVLFIIAEHDPYVLTDYDIAKKLNINISELKDVISSLLLIKAIEKNKDKFKICFPAFLKDDVSYMEKALNGVCSDIINKITRLKYKLLPIVNKFRCRKLFSVERMLYHIICDSIFDGTAFDFFENKKLFCTSKKQPGDRDYLIIGYEDCEEVEISSNKLLCSSNNYRCNGITFNSFGDSDGLRKDMYRFSRIFIENPKKIPLLINIKNLPQDILSENVNNIVTKCANLSKDILSSNQFWDLLNEDDYATACLLHELGYINNNEQSNLILLEVPVIYSDEIQLVSEISDMILNEIYEIVKSCFDNFSKYNEKLTSIKHGVDIKELGNELWHQIFGFTNEMLVECEFVQKPMYYKNEGRYLRSMLIQ